MLPIIIGAGIIVVGLYAILSAEEQRQHNAYQQERQRFDHDRQQQRGQMVRCRQQAAEYRDYHAKVALHHHAVQTANQAYALYAQGKQMRDQVQVQLRQSGALIGMLKQQRVSLTGIERQQVNEQLARQRQTHSAIKVLLQQLGQQLEYDYAQLKAFNHETAALKFDIRDHSGALGQRWFERLQQRTLARG